VYVLPSVEHCTSFVLGESLIGDIRNVANESRVTNVLITGSLYLVGAALSALNFSE
jgi:hypothetical protein